MALSMCAGMGLKSGKITNPGKDKPISTKAFILSYVQFQYCMDYYLIRFHNFSYLSSLRILKNTVLYGSIAVIALHLLVGDAPKYF